MIGTGPKTEPKTEPQPRMEDLLTIAEVAKILRVDVATVRRWIKRGVFDAVVLPGMKKRYYRIKLSTLGRLIDEVQA